jgi:hypothetical protein
MWDRDDDPVDENGDSIVWNEMLDELHEVVPEILSQPARTVADLALQARALVTKYCGEVDGPWMCLAENVCGVAGVDLLPGLDRQVQS